MRKRIVFITLLILIILGFQGKSQVLSTRLEQLINTSESPALIKANIFISGKVDFYALRDELEGQKIPVSQRPKRVITKLEEFSELSQKGILSRIGSLKKSFPGEIGIVKSFWIVNMIHIEASPWILATLSQFPGVELVDLDQADIEYPNPDPGIISDHAPRGVQKGIQVINAPAMWSLGYTGRGRKALGCDTGVNFTHPALSDRFLGNYFPLSQCWFPYENPWPVDVVSSTHGTHTMGTILGLNNQAGDTIGVAYNAYWMATDPIVSNLADVKPVSWILASFQWAINPDGNIETSDDVPDVINNSWGLTNSGNQSHCNSPINQIFDAVEAAGIGVVFSAGNDGPGAGTIGEPANIVINAVNVFSVGSVLGSSSGLPVSGFSSRGPSNCVVDDSTDLWFKPEVVAPGENVWSSIGTNQYGSLSGTSMASPHVSGAFLLLKEAFPELTGTQILTALYQSAHDLGNPGEDNSYGRGVINVLAAYNLLCGSFTPAPPLASGYDIAISGFEGMPQYISDSVISLLIKVKNKGSNAVPGFTLSYSINGEGGFVYNWEGTLAPGETISLPFSDIPAQPGINHFEGSVSLWINEIEMDQINNTRQSTFFRIEPGSFPHLETFENATMDFSGSQWFSVNYDSSYTWLCDTVGALAGSVQSAVMPFFKYSSRKHQVDELISPEFQFPDTGKVWFKFTRAYQRKMSFYKDSLKIMISTDHGATFPFTLYSFGCVEMATLSQTSSSFLFTPTLPEHWKTDSVELTGFAGQKVVVKLWAKNDFGNNLYVDNLSLYGTSSHSAVPHVNAQSQDVRVYPNPVKQVLKIDGFNRNISSIKLYNAMGECVLSALAPHLVNRIISLDCSSLKPGIYHVTLRIDNELKTFKVVKVE